MTLYSNALASFGLSSSLVRPAMLPVVTKYCVDFSSCVIAGGDTPGSKRTVHFHLGRTAIATKHEMDKSYSRETTSKPLKIYVLLFFDVSKSY